MLVIRMQRTGRKGHAQFRVVVQDSRRTPTSGKVVAAIGSYNPHTKTALIDKEKAAKYIENGAQPSDRVARLLQAEGVKLPGWVKVSSSKAGVVRNADKRRSTRPPEPTAPAEEAPAAAEAPTEVTEAVPAASEEVATATPTTEAEAETEEAEATPEEKAPEADAPTAEAEATEDAA